VRVTAARRGVPKGLPAFAGQLTSMPLDKARKMSSQLPGSLGIGSVAKQLGC